MNVIQSQTKLLGDEFFSSKIVNLTSKNNCDSSDNIHDDGEISPDENNITKEALEMIYSNQKSINDIQNPSLDASNGKITLWQFLLELLFSPQQYSEIIRWTNNEGEFVLLQAEEVAKLWGLRKDKNHRMNYDKLSRALRYYYQKNIIKKVHGHKFVYQFSDWKTLMAMHKQQMNPQPQTVCLGANTNNNSLDTLMIDQQPPVIPVSNMQNTIKREEKNSPIVQEDEVNIVDFSQSNNNNILENNNNQTNLNLEDVMIKSFAENNNYLVDFWLSIFEKIKSINVSQQPITDTSQEDNEPANKVPRLQSLQEAQDTNNSSILLGKHERASSPNCNCSCHRRASSVLPMQNSPLKQQQIKHRIEECNQSEIGVQLHHKRHTINMQRLTEQILLHTSKQQVAVAERTPQQRTIVDLKRKAILKQVSSEIIMQRKPELQENVESRSAAVVGQDQNCVWMPVPIGMLNHWTNILNI